MAIGRLRRGPEAGTDISPRLSRPDYLAQTISPGCKPLELHRQLGDLLQRGGLATVVQREIRLPLGRRFRRVGAMMETNFLALFAGLKGLIVAMGITTPEIFDSTVQEAMAEMERGSPAGVLYISYGLRSDRYDC